MGTRGPNAKPLELKVLEGNRGNRPLDLSAMFRPEVGLPDIPRHLTKEARKCWKRLTPELLRYNLLSTVDRDALAMLCQTVGRIELFELALTKKQTALVADGKEPTDAFMDTTPNGLRIQSAAYQILNKEYEKAWRYLDAFGLKPDARAAVTKAISAQGQLFSVPGGDKPDEPPKQGGFGAFR